jgi:hypothetical protein
MKRTRVLKNKVGAVAEPVTTFGQEDDDESVVQVEAEPAKKGRKGAATSPALFVGTPVSSLLDRVQKRMHSGRSSNSRGGNVGGHGTGASFDNLPPGHIFAGIAATTDESHFVANNGGEELEEDPTQVDGMEGIDDRVDASMDISALEEDDEEASTASTFDITGDGPGPFVQTVDGDEFPDWSEAYETVPAGSGGIVRVFFAIFYY